MAVQQINVTLGTAGHIDHGKTALVKLLTGCDTDRLKEEKERGMSIELGFAPCRIADTEVGIVDVPGQENFIKTMVAGATGMDAVMLVVAADDGVMPQTREHLEILTLLGIQRGLIALTKIDRVDDEQRKAALEHLHGFLHGTFLEGTPICPISSVTGEGFDGFYTTLCKLMESIEPRRLDGVFRLPVDRAFSATGFGTVLAGVPVCGSARVEDEVVLLPHGLRGRIRQIEVYGRGSDLVKAGQCAAINVRHWDASQIRRGEVLTLPGYFQPHEWFAARLELLPETTIVLKSGTQLKLHTGTAEIPVTVYPLEHNLMAAGDEGLVQFRAPAGLIAGPGDPFIVRVPSPARTIGGGMLVEGGSRRLKRNRPQAIDAVRRWAAVVRDGEQFVTWTVRTASSGAIAEAELSVRAKVPPKRLADILANLAQQGEVVRLQPGLYAHRETLGDLCSRVLQSVERYHQESPESPGILLDDLRDCSGLDRTVANAVVARLRAENRLVDSKGRLALPEHSTRFLGADAEHSLAIEALFREHLFSPPGMADLRERTGADEATVKRILNALRQQQRLVRVEGDLIFHREAIERARTVLVEYFEHEERLESVRFKYLLDTTRKYAIPLLDYFDHVGITRRVGNTRYLKERGREGGPR